MRQQSWCSTLNRRISVRPWLLFSTASVFLLLFLAGPSSFGRTYAGSVAQTSPAGPHYAPPASTYASVAAQHPQATAVNHRQEPSDAVHVTVARTGAPKPLGVYRVPGSTIHRPQSSVGVPTLFCPPGVRRETSGFAATGASVAAVPAATLGPSPARTGSKHVAAGTSGFPPECTVRPFSVPVSPIGGHHGKVVVMQRATPSPMQLSSGTRHPGTHKSAYIVDATPLPTSGTGTLVQEKPPQDYRSTKTLCLRRTWPTTRATDPWRQVCAPVSTLHTYDPVAPPVSAATSATHVHGPALTTAAMRYDAARTLPRYDAARTLPRYEAVRTLPRYEAVRTLPRYEVARTLPRYEVTGPSPRLEAARTLPRLEAPRTPPRYEAAQPPSHSRRFSLHEPVTCAGGESVGTTETTDRRHSETEGHEALAWPRATHMVSTGSHLLKRRTGSSQGVHLALLQMEIDDFCVKRFQTLCSSQGGRFCTNSPVVGRYGPGGANDMGGWRCYNKDEMGMHTRSVGCVDQCGNLMRCLGAPSSKTTSVPVPELEEWVLQRKWQHCSAYQQAADALCNFKTSGDLARYDLHRKRWMCLDLDDIAFEGTSYCVDNCGGPIPCVGGLVTGVVPKFTVHIAQHPDMEMAFEAIQPCPDQNDVCIATILNPPRCVKQSTTVLMQRLSAQQERMDEECQQDRDEACRRGNLREECFRLWLARYDVGPGPGGRPAWYCYPEAALDFTQISQCSDGCGNLVRCRGAPLSPIKLAVNVPKANEIMGDPSYCSAYQRAGDNYCRQKYGSGFVARQHCKTLQWQCLHKDRLPSQGWVGCIGHCAERTTCPAGVDDMTEIPKVEDAELARTIASVPSPCPPGETCEPTKQAPPYCSISRPRHTTVWKEDE